MNDGIPERFEVVPGVERFVIMIGPLYQKWDNDRLICGFRADVQHLNAGGLVHGGMLTTLADHTLSVFIARTVGAVCATISLNSDYLASARAGDWVQCTPTITRTTRSLIFARAQISASDRPVMSASGVWKRLGVD